MTVAMLVALPGAPHAQPGLSEPIDAPPIGPEPTAPESTAPESTGPAPPGPTDLLVRFEVGALHETTRIGSMVGTIDDQETGILRDGALLAARGLSFRLLLGPGAIPGYMGFETTIGWLDDPPSILPPRSGIVPSTDTWDDEGDWSPNTLVGVRLIAGGEGRFGRLFVGGEVAAGLVSVQLGGERERDPWVHDPRFVLDLRGRAGLWLSPNISVALMTSTSVVRSDERSMQLMVGVAFGD